MGYKFCSLDTSTRISGAALFEDGKLVDYRTIDLSKNKDSERRLDEMGKELLLLLKAWNPNSILIEHPQGKGGNVLIVNKLSEILGIVRSYTLFRDCEYREINPSEWRKWAGISKIGKTRSELKKASIEYVKENFGIECGDDLADAIAIGISSMNYYEYLGGK